ncbi:DUF4147 domain-containing protein [Amorphus sp. 3PC139-8]|uniref:DUF4147 domain-containing protein n=1 Tax=Amorphus sp. 3PC139-8 TaxID=2735676 RepID=UPI00345C7BA4
MRSATRDLLGNLFWLGVEAVKGEVAVGNWVSTQQLERPTRILAVGKAALAMFNGLPDDWRRGASVLIVTKTGHLGETVFGHNVVALETAHPVPDRSSLEAGRRALDFVESCGPNDRLLMLVSGGASSLLEHLREGVSHDTLVSVTTAALAEGADIAELNRRRNELSAVKGGRLLSQFGGAKVDVAAISDVRGDDIGVIGSGIAACAEACGFDYNCEIVASNAIARQAILAAARAKGPKIVADGETLYGDVEDVAAAIASEVDQGANGLYVYGGEPTVVLPENPGLGGRNQTLALLLAAHFQGRDDVIGLVAGTDGTDGPTEATGAFFDGETYQSPAARDALTSANSAEYLAGVGDQFVTGPTGTNVMDLALILKSPGGSRAG